MSETGWNILGKSRQPLRQKANAYIKRPEGAVPAWSVCQWGVVGTSPSSSSIIKQQVGVRIVGVGERDLLPDMLCSHFRLLQPCMVVCVLVTCK